MASVIARTSARASSGERAPPDADADVTRYAAHGIRVSTLADMRHANSSMQSA